MLIEPDSKFTAEEVRIFHIIKGIEIKGSWNKLSKIFSRLSPFEIYWFCNTLVFITPNKTTLEAHILSSWKLSKHIDKRIKKGSHILAHLEKLTNPRLGRIRVFFEQTTPTDLKSLMRSRTRVFYISCKRHRMKLPLWPNLPSRLGLEGKFRSCWQLYPTRSHGPNLYILVQNSFLNRGKSGKIWGV